MKPILSLVNCYKQELGSYVTHQCYDEITLDEMTLFKDLLKFLVYTLIFVIHLEKWWAREQIYIPVNIFLLKNVELWLSFKYLLKTALQGIKTGTRASKTKGKFSWKVEKNGGEMWCSHTWSGFEKAESYWAYWHCQVNEYDSFYLSSSFNINSIWVSVSDNVQWSFCLRD